MKKNLLTLLFLAVSLAGFAQGKVRFGNDTLHMVYLSPDPFNLAFGDVALAGTAYNGQVLAGGETLLASLYAGTSASSLSLVTTTDFTSFLPGEFNPVNTILPFSGVGTAYFQVQIYDSRDSNFAQAAANAHYYGESSVFTSGVNYGVAYFSLVQHTSPVFSTWADGTFPLDSVLAGAEGAIAMMTVPEPTMLALAGLGVALLGWRRRRV